MKTLLALLSLVILTITFPLDAAAPVHITVSQVLDMMQKTPDKAHPSRPGNYDKAGDSKIVAEAISDANLDKNTTSLVVVFSAYESSNQVCVGGDKDEAGNFHSWGILQLADTYVSKTVACDPRQAIDKWLALKATADATCKDNNPDERLALITGGTCTNRGGQKVSRIRMKIARDVAAASP